MADLHFLRTLFGFVWQASRTLLQQLLAFLNFTEDSENLLLVQKLWQLHKQMKTMEINLA